MAIQSGGTIPDVGDYAVVLEPESIGIGTVNEDFATSLKGVFAGGDCVASGTDLTVQSVADGRDAAMAIDAYLRGEG